MKKLFFLLLLSSILSSTFLSAELNLELPNLGVADLGLATSSFISSGKIREQGLTTLRRLRATRQIIEDPEINIWIRSLGNKLISNAPYSSTPYYFLVSKDTSVNAFATMGGVIVINAGLILQTSNESELAAVISHEVAHITQQHIKRMIDKSKNNKLLGNIALLAGVIASEQDPQIGQAIINTTVATLVHKQLSFSRKAETEADRVGIRILARSGFNPIGMPNFLSKLNQYNADKNSNQIEYLQNHPLTFKRVTDTQVLAKQLGNKNRKENTHYLFMREKIRHLINASVKTDKNIPAFIHNYAKALIIKKYQKPTQALKLLSNDIKRHVSSTLLAAELLIIQKKNRHAIKILTPLYNIYPDDPSIAILLSSAQMGLEHTDEAWKTLSNISVSEQTSLEYFDSLQNIARMSNRTTDAYLAAASRNTRKFNYKAATLQLEKALRLQTTSLSNTLKIQKQLQNLPSQN